MSRRRRIFADLSRRLHVGSLSRAGSRLRAEAGFAVPTVTLMLLAAMGLAGVAITASISGQSGVVHDRNTKTALGIAESGVEEALLLYNRHGRVKEGEDPCVPLERTLEAGGWCGTRQTAVSEGSVSYRVRPEQTVMPSGEIAWTEIEVVSTGTLSGLTRRLDFVANSAAGQNPFIDATVQSRDGIELKSNSEIHAGTATNGDLTIEDNASQCGTATVGVGKEKKGGGEYSTDFECGTVGGEPGEDEIELPPVDPGETWTKNDNYRLFTLDRISIKGSAKNAACFDGHNGIGQATNACGKRELVIDSNASVTLSGTVYSFCRLELKSNSSLYVAPPPGKTTRIYFDSPEECGYEGEEEPVTQLELSQNTRITSQSGSSASVSLLFVGSPYIATKVLMRSETSIDDPVLCEQNFVIYAPYTDVEMDSNTSFCGAMAAKTVVLDSNAEVWTGTGLNEWYLPLTAPHYVSSRFVDCAATVAAGAPDEGC
jgi:hypothetical protein